MVTAQCAANLDEIESHVTRAGTSLNALSLRRGHIEEAFYLTGVYFDKSLRDMRDICGPDWKRAEFPVERPDALSILVQEENSSAAPLLPAAAQETSTLLSYSLCKTKIMFNIMRDPKVTEITALTACQRAEKYLRTAFVCALRLEKSAQSAHGPKVQQ